MPVPVLTETPTGNFKLFVYTVSGFCVGATVEALKWSIGGDLNDAVREERQRKGLLRETAPKGEAATPKALLQRGGNVALCAFVFGLTEQVVGEARGCVPGQEDVVSAMSGGFLSGLIMGFRQKKPIWVFFTGVSVSLCVGFAYMMGDSITQDKGYQKMMRTPHDRSERADVPLPRKQLRPPETDPAAAA
ncbi:hypothetical protein M885DRAFT_605047 [Pelagophyceae sp. CCMP2097]|nr:hypothetical protein M885DRAFT_605047 [Pelagophyceae sp. CCMP2097]